MVYPPVIEAFTLVAGIIRGLRAAKRALERRTERRRLNRQEELGTSLENAIRRIQSEYDKDMNKLRPVGQAEVFSKGDGEFKNPRQISRSRFQLHGKNRHESK
jgi:hypothetical protein